MSKADELLKDALYCFNELPNKKISKQSVKSTYELAKKIEMYFKEKEETKDRQPEN
jgi:hypothetical protein